MIELEIVIAENLQTLLQELTIENESSQPELSILSKNTFVNRRCNLNLARNCERNSALVKEFLRGLLVALRGLVLLQNDAIIVGELVEPILIDEAVALVNQNVSIFGLIAALVLENTLHVRIMLILLHLSFPMLVLATEAFIRDLSRIKMLDHRVIEFVPLSIAIFSLLSILNESVVVACL